jgi:hypothetical protein
VCGGKDGGELGKAIEIACECIVKLCRCAGVGKRLKSLWGEGKRLKSLWGEVGKRSKSLWGGECFGTFIYHMVKAIEIAGLGKLYT